MGTSKAGELLKEGTRGKGEGQLRATSGSFKRRGDLGQDLSPIAIAQQITNSEAQKEDVLNIEIQANLLKEDMQSGREKTGPRQDATEETMIQLRQFTELAEATKGRRRGTDLSGISSLKIHSLAETNGSEDDETESYCLSDAGLAAVAAGFTKLEKLSLIWCSNVTHVGLRSIAEKCVLLKSLDLQGYYVGDQGLAAVGEFSKHLEDLNLRFCEGLTDAGLIKLVNGSAKTLKSISLAACAKVTNTSLEAAGSHYRSLESLSLDSEFIHDKGVLAVAQGCPQLKVLKLQCINVTDGALQGVDTCCLSLELLALYSFQIFTDKSLCAIGKGCKRLKSLTLNDCTFLSDRGLEAVAVGCAGLTHLEVNGCHNIGTYGLESIARSCTRLLNDWEVVSVTKFFKVLEIFKGTTDNEDFMIWNSNVGNKGIIAVGENCKFLTDLSLRFCDRVGDEALVAIGEGCSLHHLNVSGCHQIGDAGIISIARGCPELSYLDVSVLQDLGDIAMMELGEGCPLLRDIVLSHCRQITDVGLSYLAKNCTLLETCHMVYCPGITAAGVATVITSCINIKKVLVEKWKLQWKAARLKKTIVVDSQFKLQIAWHRKGLVS
ncbi:hypothetical protein HAX54_043829 [Datura stramonium]|uniref:F-box/LRR-repeat protein 15-like leucin rich repeat domain-containing protein n=1 Tax=Datura stramonium TaxID=4076 RepID=A0ABS8W1L8_DATST|nr:hypothetical protein [Datura stramonium]